MSKAADEALHRSLPRGQVFDVPMLRSFGISSQLACWYVDEGWLVRLAHGVYAHAGEDTPWHVAIGLVRRRAGGLHVGGTSALSMHGIGHDPGVGESVSAPIVLWGAKHIRWPNWLRHRYPVRYVGAPLFSSCGLDIDGQTLVTLPGQPEGLRVSVPERAVLEMLYEVGRLVSPEEARCLFARLPTPREALIRQLLFACNSRKTAYLYRAWSAETRRVDGDVSPEASIAIRQDEASCETFRL